MDTNQQQQNQQQAVAPAIDPTLLKGVVTEAMQEIAAQNQPVRTIDDMSPEERKEYLQLFDPSDNGFVDRFQEALNDAESADDRLKVFNEMRDGIVNQALRGAELLMEQRMAQLQQQIAPAVQASRQQQAEQLWNDFSTQHPDLANQREMVDALSTQLAATGFKPKNKDELFNKVAEISRNVLSKAGVKLQAPQQVPQQNNQPRQMPRMTQTQTTASGPGGGSSSSVNPDGRGIAPFFLNRRR